MWFVPWVPHEAGFGHLAVHQLLSVLSPRAPVWTSLDHSPKRLWQVEISLYVGSSCGMQVAFHDHYLCSKRDMVFHHYCDGHIAWNLPAPKMKEIQIAPPKSSQNHIFFPPDVIKGRTAGLKTFILEKHLPRCQPSRSLAYFLNNLALREVNT